ncbi:MAG: hypothetical protein GY934_15115, partial [Gammaproteobacteria bacterium]|nr:hypothetical protein [Gammaproteobacteria bacterium]
SDGSGVDPSSLIVSLNTVGPLFMPKGLPSGSTSSLTSFDGNNWTLTYTFFNFAPSGEYQVWISGADNVGNHVTTHVGTIMLDGQSPLARLDSWAAPDVISDTTSLFTGLAIEQPDWGGARAEYHFEGQNGDTIFNDSSNNDNHSEVCSSCPAIAPGLFGSSADFSEGDMLTIPADESLNMGQEFSLAFWINP